jgi:CHAT domain-containing protein/tetratricopeptide (TPR) repeat protein
VAMTNSLAVLYTRRGDYDRALPVLQKGLAAAEQSLDEQDPLYIQFVNNLGDLYRRLDEFAKAEPYFTRALALLEKASGPDHLRVATPLVNLAVIARERQEYARAFELLNRALTIRTKALGESSRPSAETLVLMANVHHAKTEYSDAVALLEKALPTLELTAGPYHRSTMMALANLSRAKAALGEVDAAIEYEGRVQRIVEINLALNLRMTGSERQKLAYFDETNQRTDRVLSFSNQLAPRSPEATRLAVEVVLQRKGRVLDAVAGGFAVLREQLDRDNRRLFEELQATTSRFAALALNGPGRSIPIAEYETELRSLEARQEALEAEISRTSGAFRAASQPSTLPAVQRAIPAEAALVEFIRYEPYSPTAREERLAYGDPRYAAYVIRNSGAPIGADLGPAAPIEAAISELRQSLRDPRRGDSKQRARALDRLVLEPVRARIGKEGRLLISPDGALNLVPFETLVDAEGRYAVESYSISYLTSGRDLLRLQVPRESRSMPVVIANPDFGEPARAAGSRAPVRSVTSSRNLASTYFAPLTGTAREAAVIQSLFPKATILTGERATKSALRAIAAPAILHIASHGFFLDSVTPPQAAPNTRAARSSARPAGNPLVRSGIALAQANVRQTAADSGILTALEASSLNLWGTQLVTLSACDTGLGEIRHGEGVYGLRRAFLLAGAESIVMSLWPVSDGVTRQMMQIYYSGLKKGLGRGEALRAAQLEMLRSRPHPFYWGGFIQAGAWGPVRTPPS